MFGLRPKNYLLFAYSAACVVSIVFSKFPKHFYNVKVSRIDKVHA